MSAWTNYFWEDWFRCAGVKRWGHGRAPENLFWVSGKVGFRVSCLGSKGLRALGFRVEGFREVGPLGLRVRAVGRLSARSCTAADGAWRCWCRVRGVLDP